MTAVPPPASHEPRVRLARMWLRAGQPLGAALLLTELTLESSRDPEVWCGLGAALMGARGTLVRKPFEQWAARVFHQAGALVRGTPFAEVAVHWQAQLPPPGDAPLEGRELAELFAFLQVTDDVWPAAIDGLPPADHMLAVMVLGDHSPHAAPVIRAAVGGRWGAAAARAALKRAGRFAARDVDVRAAIVEAAGRPGSAELEPYLGWAIDGFTRPR